MDTAPAPVVGSLADMPGTDVLRALARASASGILKVGDSSAAWAAFAEGHVLISVVDDSKTLTDALRSSGAVDAAVLRDVIGRSGGHDLAVLHELVALPGGDLTPIVRAHTVDAVFQMVLPSSEQFAFQPGAPLSLAQRFAYDVEELLDAAAARVREWAEVAATVPTTQAVFRARRSLDDATGPVTVERDQWPVLAVLDGRRTVAQVIAATGRGSFEVLTALHRLVQAGLVERIS